MCKPTINPGKRVGEGRYAYICPPGSHYPKGHVDEIVLTIHLSGQGLSKDAIIKRRNRLRDRCDQLTNKGKHADAGQTITDLESGRAAGYLQVSEGGIWTLDKSVVDDLANQVPLCGDVDVKTP